MCLLIGIRHAGLCDVRCEVPAALLNAEVGAEPSVMNEPGGDIANSSSVHLIDRREWGVAPVVTPWRTQSKLRTIPLDRGRLIQRALVMGICHRLTDLEKVVDDVRTCLQGAHFEGTLGQVIVCALRPKQVDPESLEEQVEAFFHSTQSHLGPLVHEQDGVAMKLGMQHIVACMATVGAHLLHNVVRPVVRKDAHFNIGRGLEAIDPIEAPKVDTGSKRELGCRPCGTCCSGIAIRAEHHRWPGLVRTPLDKLRMEMIQDAFVLVAALQALQVDCVCLEERRLKHAIVFNGRAFRAHKLHRAQGIAPVDLGLSWNFAFPMASTWCFAIRLTPT